MLSATASLGLILLWDVDAGLTEIDKYLYSGEDNVKVGFSGVLGTSAHWSCLFDLQFIVELPHPPRLVLCWLVVL